jgi:DNA polymerase III sliding clamp (beta) subunit (PCNA family)
VKLKAKIGDLLEAVTQVSATLDRKGEVSGKMHIRASNKGCLYLYSTNMTAETLTKIPAEVEEEGQVLVDHHKIQDGLNGLNREAEVLLSLTPSGGTLKGQSGKTKFSAPASAEVGEMASRIKALPFSEASTSKIPAGTLAEFLRRGMFCIPLDKTGQYASLAGMKISDNGSGYEAMASDNAIACRIHVETKETGLGKGIVIPYASLGATEQLAQSQAWRRR